VKRKRLYAVGGGLVVIAMIGVACVYYWLTCSHPCVEGEMKLDGLRAPVEVCRDRYGVPHIYARNTHDLFFAQGFVMAQDRLWQMDLFRRLGEGKLAEVFGEEAINADVFSRTLGLERAAEREVDTLCEASRAVLEAFSEGINAYIATHRDRLPLEFRLLGYRPELWKPRASLVIGKVIFLILARNAASEIARAELVSRLGARRAAELFPPYSGEMVSDALTEPAHAWSPFRMFAGGSNNWVVGGVKSVTGKPLLANDPHLGVFLPSIWYENHLDGEAYRVTGASFPGTPAVIIGHNGRIAWGITSMEADVQDLYVERVSPDNPLLYDCEGSWEKMMVVREKIRVKGERDPMIVEVRRTRHGPIINRLMPGLDQALALRCVVLEGTSDNLSAFLLLNRAQNWREFQDALKRYQGPPQNFVYADAEGNIGYWGAGKLPIRRTDFGLCPVDGTSGKYEWVGFVSFEMLPHCYNPRQHFIVTANNRPLESDYPYYISREWAPPFRFQRITERLRNRERLSLRDLQDIQADVVSIPARLLTPYLLELESRAPRVQEAQRYLKGWDVQFSVDSVPATIYHMTLRYLVEKTFGDDLKDALPRYLDVRFGLLNSPHTRGVELLLKIIDDPINAWFDDIRTEAREDRDEILRHSLHAALEELMRELGPDMREWKWGKVHRCVFEHPFGKRWPLGHLFNLRPIPLGGEKYTVNHAGFTLTRPLAVNTIASYRQVIDLSDFARSVAIHAPGQSGHPLHSHYRDLAPLWARGKYHPMYFSKRDVQVNTRHLLRLVPQREEDS